MSRWVKQSDVSSVTPRSRRRTAYLSTLVPEVLGAIADYHDAAPRGVEFTLEALSRIGRGRLQALAPDKSLSQLKQDTGLLVAQSLSDLFGASNVETLRRDRSDGVAAQRHKRSDLSWVTRYTPHRVLAPLKRPDRIVLDTSVIRNVIHRDDAAIDLERLNQARGDHPISVADTALAELCAALVRGAIPFADWQKNIRAVGEVLDPELPLAPGGRELAAMWGGGPKLGTVDDMCAYYQAIWDYMMAIEGAGDFARGGRFQDKSGRVYRFELSETALKESLSEAESRWQSVITRASTMARELEERGHHVSTEFLAELSQIHLLQVFSAAEVKKLDLLIRVLATRTRDAVAKPAYKPNKLNDAIDFDLLFAVPLPAVICTHDSKLIGLVKRSGSSDSWRVMTPVDLVNWLESNA